MPTTISTYYCLRVNMMRVVSTTGRGPATVYTLTDGERTWQTTGRAEIPEEVFKKWRQFQAARCMKVKRENALACRVKTEAETKPNIQQVKLEEAKSSKLDASVQTEEQRAIVGPVVNATRAQNLVICKVCHESEVNQLIIPCGHLVFCRDCLLRDLTQRNVCPICREKINDYIAVRMIE